MKVFLVRHGETTSDIEDRYGGDYDDHLTEKGVSQAKELAKALSGKKIELLYHSPKARATETAVIIGEEIKVPLFVLENFRERNNYGLLSGMVKKEAAEKFPMDVKELELTPVNHKVRGSENYLRFKERVLRALKVISNEDNAVVAVVTHGGPIRCVLRELFGKEIAVLKDCAMVELDGAGKDFKIVSTEGIEWKQPSAPEAQTN